MNVATLDEEAIVRRGLTDDGFALRRVDGRLGEGDHVRVLVGDRAEGIAGGELDDRDDLACLADKGRDTIAFLWQATTSIGSSTVG